MSGIRIAIPVVWLVFWVYWLISAAGAKKAVGGRVRPPGLIIIVLVGAALRVFHTGGYAVHSTVAQVIGAVVFAAGLALAVWARLYLGRNWGMPMTHKEEPELVTSGPYRFVRHPIYSGILLGMVGTALATNLWWLIAFLMTGAYFVHSARVEEGIMAKTFPDAYPSYRMQTKMIIPFVL
ncbi:MAG TPA: isoprenylcysteine carboxylmethyltransferase family protein [Solirubrobacteraceae bacterium]|jgi:protein-S-isoprenylcysteine O-methyltransferase Ste14|nr:isoprenylcysteine carboxylmethyltransferase family protein [Solirubrobacteraceae bacterium]